MDKLKSAGGENQTTFTRKQIESVVTQIQITAKEAPTPGWILGDCMTATRGRGGPGCSFVNGGGRGGRLGMLPGWRGTGGNRWSPFKESEVN